MDPAEGHYHGTLLPLEDLRSRCAHLPELCDGGVGVPSLDRTELTSVHFDLVQQRLFSLGAVATSLPTRSLSMISTKRTKPRPPTLCEWRPHPASFGFEGWGGLHVAHGRKSS